MLGDLYQADVDTALDNLAAQPPERPKPVAKWNGWSAPLRGLAAGAAEVGAFAADAAKGYGQIMSAGGTEKAGGMFSLQSDAEKRESELQRFKLDTQGVDTTSEAGTALRDVARDYRPDPATAGLAERLTFDLTRFLGKAVGYTVAGAGVPGAVALGSDEAMVVADDLARAGVDPATRMQAGAVAGVAAAAGVVLPVAAPGSILKTAGLWALGGPGAFVAQQAATREILAQSDYGDLAAQYDPLDPVGLAVSSLVPAGFAAWAVRGAMVKPAAPGAKPAAPDVKPSPAITPEQVDAAMVHNLTLLRDAQEAAAVARAAAPPSTQPRFEENLRQISGDEARALVAGKTEKPGGVDPVQQIQASEGNGKRFLFGEVPLREIRANEDGARYDGTVDDVRMRDYAARDSEAPPVILVRSRVTGELSVLDGGHRVSAARIRGDETVQAIIVERAPRGSTDLAPTSPPAPKVTPMAQTIEALTQSSDPAVRNVGEGIKKAADVLGPEQMAAVQRAADAYTQARASGDSVAKAVEAMDLPPEVNNLLAGIVENAHSPKRIEAMAREVMKTVQDFKTNAADVTADAVERLRSLTDEQISGEPAKPAKGSVDPLLASIEERIARVEQMVPDMVVRTDDAGQPVTVAKEMARIRDEAKVGTDMELGADDAQLLTVAANCAIGVGA